MLVSQIHCLNFKYFLQKYSTPFLYYTYDLVNYFAFIELGGVFIDHLIALTDTAYYHRCSCSSHPTTLTADISNHSWIASVNLREINKSLLKPHNEHVLLYSKLYTQEWSETSSHKVYCMPKNRKKTHILKLIFAIAYFYFFLVWKNFSIVLVWISTIFEFHFLWYFSLILTSSATNKKNNVMCLLCSAILVWDEWCMPNNCT